MDIKDKIVGLALACLIALIGWQLHQTWGLKEEVLKLQQGQIVLSEQIKKTLILLSVILRKCKKRIGKRRRKRRMNKHYIYF